MKSIKKILVTTAMLLSIVVYGASIKNAKTIQAKIFGNCDMCKATIEKAGNVNNVVLVEWNKDTKIAAITFNEAKTTPEDILKRVALAGYDSAAFLAPGDAYSKLPGCCQYERTNKMAVIENVITDTVSTSINAAEGQTQGTGLESIFEIYFQLKDALVKSDGKLASQKSKDLLTGIGAVKMEKLQPNVHTAWMKYLKQLTSDASGISQTQDIKKQRDWFKSLSESTYELLKVSGTATPVYYNHCPMVDANWLSRESAIKNPYYGSQMLTCGKTVETIK